VRASAASVVAPDSLVQSLTAMGMQPYGMVAPTGYSTKATSWENTGAVLARINFSSALTQGKLPGIQFDPADLLALRIVTSFDLSKTESSLGDSRSGLNFAIALIDNSVLSGDISAAETAIIRKEM
jgi:hypothetical protein